MDADKFVARWTIIIHDEHGPKAAPWQQAMTPGASFEITKDAYGVFWYLPSPEMKAPMNQPCRLATSREKHGSFDVGVLLPGTEREAAMEVAERLRRSVAARVAVAGVPVTLSIGLAELRPGMETIEDWTGAADEALYRAKEAGRDCVRD